MKKAFSNLCFVVCLAIIVWFTISFIDVNMCNQIDATRSCCASWNLFELLYQLFNNLK